MQCPLCRENVADDNALQVHYLMSCLGYLENPSANKKDETISKKIVQFRWVKSKPTLAREVYLISSLAGSVKLEWQEIDECFLSEQVEVPQGLHSCQLVVDSDALPTEDFNVSDSSRTIDVFVSEAEEPVSSLSEGDDHESQTRPTSHGNHGDDKDTVSDRIKEVPARNLPAKGSLYRELLTHQILHGDSLETLTGSSHGELGEGSGYQSHGTRGNDQRERARGNLLTGRNDQDKSSNTPETNISQSHQSLTGYDGMTRNDGDQPKERLKNAVPLRDSISSGELEQFLQPTRTRKENGVEEDHADNEVGTTEERESSHSENEDISVSISSNGDFESRPELPGQSNGENESRAQHDGHHGVSNHVPVVGGDESRITNREQSSGGHSQEALLIDLREPASGDDRHATNARREISSGHDREKSPAELRERSSSRDSRRTSDDRRNGRSNDHHVSMVKGREGISGDFGEQSSANDFRRLSDDHRDISSSVREKPLLVERGGHPSSGLLSETSGGSLSHINQSGSDRERTPGVAPYGHHREESSFVNREKSSGVDRETTSSVRREETAPGLGNDTLASLRNSHNDSSRNSDDHREAPVNNSHSGDFRTEISGDLRQETSKGIQERTSSDNRQPASDDQEASDDGREQASVNHRNEVLDEPREESLRGRENISKSTAQKSANNSEETALSVSTSSFSSPPYTLSPSITQDTQSEVFVNSLTTANIRTSRQEQRSTSEIRDIPTEDRISPRVAGTSLPISLEGGIARTTTLTDDLLFRSYSTSSTILRTYSTFSSQNTIAPSKYTTALGQSAIAPTQYSSAPSTYTSPLRREIARSNVTSDPSRHTTAPWIATNASISSSRETGSLSRQTSAPTIATQSGGRIAPRRVTSAPNINTSVLSRDDRSQDTSTQSNNPQSVSSVSLVDSYSSTRRSPQGSFFSDSDVRRPPLYTSAPSRPYSSLPYTPPTVISPLTSPRNDGEAVSSGSRPRTSTGTILNELQSRATLVTSQSIPDRQTPTGSAMSPVGARGAFSSSSSNTKMFSDNSVKELLDSLKKETSRRQNTSSPETSPRERLGTSEVTTLKAKLADREEYIKKLKARNAAYKEKFDDFREKEIELTKALSLAETSKQALKEQEEIASELTNALGEKEKQCAELEMNAREIKLDHRRLKSELDHVKKGHEKKVKELGRNNAILEQEVRTLRENSARFSPRSSSEYKKLLEQFLESRAVADSLKDHVKKLENENKVLQEKINALVKISPTKQDYTRDPLYSTRMYGGLGDRDKQPATSVDGNPRRVGSLTLLGQQKSDGLRSHTDSLRRRTDDGEYRFDSQRDYSGNPYESHRYVFENTRYQPQRDRSRPQSASPRSRYEEFQSHPESSRERSDSNGSELFHPSSYVVRHAWDGEQRTRRRVTTAVDVTSEVSDIDYRQRLPKRSYSSDSIRNGFPDGVHGNISPSREKGRGKDKTLLTHAGSYDNLINRTEASGLTLTGRRIEHSPTSRASTSPRGNRPGTPFAPETPQQIDQGMTVLVTRHPRGLSRGVVRYIGTLPAKGDKIYLGLELHDKEGKHDGKFNKQRFFKCCSPRDTVNKEISQKDTTSACCKTKSRRENAQKKVHRRCL